jgi:hypothetical protein
MKIGHESITNPLQSPQKGKTVNLEPKRITLRKEVQTGLLCWDYAPELNTKNLGNSLSFLSVTHGSMPD